MTRRFIATNEKKIDENQVCYYPTFVSSRWLAVRLETIGNIIILFAALFAVTARDSMDPGVVGMKSTYVEFYMVGIFEYFCRPVLELRTDCDAVPVLLGNHGL